MEASAEQSGNDFVDIRQCLMKDPLVPSWTLASSRAGLLAAQAFFSRSPLPKSHPCMRVDADEHPRRAGSGSWLWLPARRGRWVAGPGGPGRWAGPADDAG